MYADDLGVRCLALHDLAHHGLGLGLGEVRAGHDLCDGFFDHRILSNHIRHEDTKTPRISSCLRAFVARLGLQFQEVPQQVLPRAGQDGLGVELDALDLELLVPHAHDDAVVGPGG